MVSRRNRKANHIPLIVEPHPSDYDGYPFITLIQYREKHILTVIDNATEKEIGAFVLDLCSPEGIDEELTITIIADWYEQHARRYPLSIAFSKLGMSGIMKQIYRTYPIDYVARVIGPLPRFNMTEIDTVRRRRKKNVPNGVEIRNLIEF